MGLSLFKNSFSGLKVLNFSLETYPAGERKLLLHQPHSLGGFQKIVLNYKSDQDLWDLALLVDALHRAGCGNIQLEIPYLPYAREDRVMQEGASLSLGIVCAFINALKFSKVFCYDLHSPVSAALLDNVVDRDWAYLAGQLAHLENGSLLVSPDAGANKKVFAFAQQQGFPTVIRADKTRDVVTGNITGTKVFCDEHLGDLDVLIMDDICDGGRTFIELAKELRKVTDGRISLYVTHGIFSKGVDVFKGLIDNIYVSNLMGQPHELLTLLHPISE